MNGVYTNLAKKRAEQSKEPGTLGSVPPLPETPVKQAVPELVADPKPRNVPPVKPQQQEPVTPGTPAAQGFDLNHPTQKSHTFAFTFEELFAVQEVLTGLQRLLGLDSRITKIDIMRCALHMLVEDYRARGEQSHVVARFKNKKPVDRSRTKKAR